MTSENKVTKDVLIPETPSIFYDAVTGRYFRSDIKELVQDRKMFVSLNEFLSELGLPTGKIGDELGWNIDSGYTYDPLEVKMKTILDDMDIQNRIY